MSSLQLASALPDDYADYLAWKNELRHPLLRVDSSSTISTNATAPNLEGVGRTVGLLFERLGAHVEAFLNELASRRDYGPKAVAQRLRQHLRHIKGTIIQRQSKYARQITKREENILRKECRRLLKFARNRIPSTQFQALEEIICLAFEFPVARTMFAQCNVEEYLKPEFKEPELFLTSSRALNVVQNEKVHNFWRRLPDLLDLLSKTSCVSGATYTDPGGIIRLHPRKSYRGTDLQQLICFLEGEQSYSYFGMLVESLRDPSVSFLAGRYLNEAAKRTLSIQGVHVVQWILQWLRDSYYEKAVTMPSVIEWHTIDELYSITLSLSGSYGNITVAETFLLRECYDSWRELKERVSVAHLHPEEGSSRDRYGNLDGALYTCFQFFLVNTDSCSLRDHISHIRQMDGRLRKKLEGTLLISEVATAASYILYDAFPFFHRHRGCIQSEKGAFFPNNDLSDLRYASAIIASHLESKFDTDEGKKLASLLSGLCYRKSRYIKAVLVDVITNRKTSVAPPAEMSRLSLRGRFLTEEYPTRLERICFEGQCLAIWILYSNPGDALWGREFRKLSDACCKMLTYYNVSEPRNISVDSLTFRSGWTLDVHVAYGQYFDVDGHYPILAGHDVEGEPLYVATHTIKNKTYFALARNGARQATFIDGDGNIGFAEDFDVPVLRHDPIDFDPGLEGDAKIWRSPGGAMDPTGPLFWEHDSFLTEAIQNRLEEDKGHFDSDGQDSMLLEAFRSSSVAMEA